MGISSVDFRQKKVKATDSMEASAVAIDPLTTISVRTLTRTKLKRLKLGGQSYDDVIRAVLAELKQRSPWFDEMERRISQIQSGVVKSQPIKSLRAVDLGSRRRAHR